MPKKLNKKNKPKFTWTKRLKIGSVVIALTLLFGFVSALNNSSDLIAKYGGNLRNSSDNCNVVLGRKFSRVILPNNDTDQIKKIIQLEADATLTLDKNRVMGFFSEDSIIRDAKGVDWHGCAQIVQRYKDLADTLTFLEVDHTIIDLKIDGDNAIAKIFTTASYRDKRFPSYPPPYSNLGSYTANEIWSFRKGENNWEIVSFIYDSILPIEISSPTSVNP